MFLCTFVVQVLSQVINAACRLAVGMPPWLAGLVGADKAEEADISDKADISGCTELEFSSLPASCLAGLACRLTY